MIPTPGNPRGFRRRVETALHETDTVTEGYRPNVKDPVFAFRRRWY